jgi:nucleoside-diphosphate-sugar epimerase
VIVAMRCLVTGAAGFIGSHLCARLVGEGHRVVALDNLSEGTPENLRGVPQAEFVLGDLRDEATVVTAAAGCDVIFHQGALRSVHRSMLDPQETTDVNVRGTVNVLIAANANGCRVVFASSSSVYGEQPAYPLRERQRPLPCSPYGVSKLAGEIYCAMWWRTMRVPVVALRYFNVYGPRQDASSEYAVVVPRFVLACLTGQRPVIDGDGAQARDFAYIDDVVEANLLAARAREDAFGAAFNIGGGAEPTSVNRLLAMIADITGATPRPLHAPPRPGDVRMTCADLALAGRVLGYRPAVGMRAGLRRTVEWFRSEIDRTEIDRTVPARR